MPVKRKPIRRTNSRSHRRKQGKSNTAVVVISAIALFGIIYWISNPSADNKIVTKKPAASQTPEESRAENPEPQKDEAPQKVKPLEPKADTDVEKGIYRAAAKLHIDPDKIKHKVSDGLLIYTVPIDPALSDLLFANMIIKGEVENLKGKFVSGQEKNHRQILSFTDNPTGKKIQVELYYKKSEISPDAAGKYLTIIIDDFGYANGKLLNGFAETKPEVCFAILPDTKYADEALESAKRGGHEAIIHAPMEPINYPKENPGEKAIFIQLTPGEISRRMERYIEKLPGCIGVNNHMGSLATADEPAMQAVMQTLRKHNLLFVDSRTTNSSIAYKIAQKNQVPAFKRDVFLDEPDLSDATLNKRLADCIAIARTKPQVVAIMHCHSANHLAYLKRFITLAEQSGFKLVPLSKLGAYKLPAIQ